MATVDVVLVEDDTPLAHIIVVALEQNGLRVSHLDGGAMLSGDSPERNAISVRGSCFSMSDCLRRRI